jgi:hypothetical protein
MPPLRHVHVLHGVVEAIIVQAGPETGFNNEQHVKKMSNYV